MHLKFLIFPAIALLALTQAQAIEFISTTNYLSASEESISSEQWVLAEKITPSGTYGNDLFLAAADSIQLNGTYEGNVWGAGAKSIVLTGTAERNIRITGTSVRIDGPVGGNVMAMAETVIIGTNALVQGDAMLYANTIVQEGTIKGHAAVIAARVVTLSGTVEGNTTITAPKILLTRNARFLGNLSYTTDKELYPDDDAVKGELTRIVPEPEPLFSLDRLTEKTLWFFAALLAGLPFIALFPMTTAMASQILRTSPLKCLLVGLAASIGLPFLALMSVSSIIGVPLGILVMTSWGILLYVGRIVAGLVLGGLILRKVGASIGHVILSMALGLAVIYFSTVIPSIGIPVQLTALWLGVGALLISLMEKRRLILQVPNNLKQLEKLRDENHNPEEN